MQEGYDEAVDERLRAVESRAATATSTVADRRKVLRLTVSGTGRIQEVDLAPRWSRAIQAQLLDSELTALFQEASGRASEAFQADCRDAGLDAAVNGADTLLHALEHVPGGAGLLRRLDTEEVSKASAGGRVVATFRLSGTLCSLRVNTRYAAEADPTRLGAEICSVLREGQDAVEARRAELAADLLEGRSVEDILSEQVDRFRLRMDELADRLS